MGNNVISKNLEKHIWEFDFDGDAQFSFSMRVARENTDVDGRPLTHCDGLYIVQQFKVYVIMLHNFEISPPPIIGRVWDLLLTYTKLYEKFTSSLPFKIERYKKCTFKQFNKALSKNMHWKSIRENKIW